MARDDPKFMLRLPDGMREKIAVEAKENGRSMNAEIVARLERSFSYDEELPDLLQRSVRTAIREALARDPLTPAEKQTLTEVLAGDDAD